MSLGLVIPVWNDQTALTRLLDGAVRLGVFDQIIVVDDGSDDPVTLPDLRGSCDVQLIRHDTSQGPGVARNTGLAQITTDHTLFFDSDDTLTPELVPLWQDLRHSSFDFCLFRHCDSRQMRRKRWGLMGYDASLWRAAGMGGQALRHVDAAAATQLAQTANFPWNKIWRTDFLRAHGIGYSGIRVHEDIAPHWMGFLHAQTILASDRIVALHRVAVGADRLTNLQGPERLEVFDPLARVLAQLSAAPADKSALLPAYLRFACDLLDWIHANLDPRWHGALADRRRAFWKTAVPPALFDSLCQSDPALALHLTLQITPPQMAPHTALRSVQVPALC